MKHRANKWLPLSLAAAMLMQLSACGSQDKTGTAPETDPAETAAAVETVPEEPEYDRLSELGERDFGGRVYTILDSNNKPDTHINMHSGEMTGELVNDALFERDTYIEDTYAVKIAYEQIEGADIGANALKASVMANDQAYDFCISILMSGSLGSLATQGILANLLNIEDLSLDQSWWSRLMYDSMQLGGRMYYTTGDISPCMYQMAGAYFLNTGLCEDYGITTDFCQLVRDGRWTLDAAYEVAKDKNQDVNADGIMHADDDFFGFIHQSYGITTAKSILIGAGVDLIKCLDDGTLVSAVNSEKTLETLEKTARLMTDVQYVEQNDIMSKTFAEDRALSMMHFTSSASVYLREMESPYLILPMPKADEMQETYRTYANPWMDSFVAIPRTAEYDFAGFISEALAYYSYKNVRPLAYELTYMTKTARDENSAEMLGIIFDNLYLDFGCITDFGAQCEVLSAVLAGKADFSSSMAAQQKRLDKELDTFSRAWMKND